MQKKTTTVLGRAVSIAVGEVVSTITSIREIRVSTMMDEELHLQPVEQESLLRSAVIGLGAAAPGFLVGRMFHSTAG